MNLKSAVNEFLITQKIKGNSLKTIEYYSEVLQYFLDFIGDIELETLKLSDLNRYYIEQSNRKISSVTVQSYMRGLRAFLNWCYGEEYMTVKLTEKFKLPKSQKSVIDVLNDYEIHMLFSVFDLRSVLGLRDYCICSLMLDCGLRKNEVVKQTISRYKAPDGYLIVHGKGNRERVVPMGFNTRKYLLKYHTKIKNLQGDILFRKNNGDPITDNTVKQLFSRLKAQTGIQRLHPHLLRHTFATRFIENGGDVFTLQQLLGHTTLEMSKRYTHMSNAKIIEKYRCFSPIDNMKKTHFDK